jgi:hypothetical protein
MQQPGHEPRRTVPKYGSNVTPSPILTLAEITVLEQAYLAGDGAVLGPARAALASRWNSGLRDRETALRLAFLEWYSCSEPEFLTGLHDNYNEPDGDRQSYFPEIFSYLSSPEHEDDEVRFVFGWMAKSFPYCCGDTVENWEREGNSLWDQWRHGGSEPQASAFADRGAYGHYFAHIRTSEAQARPSL